MNRRPGYEYLDRIGTGRPREFLGGPAMPPADIGRPRGAAARAAVRRGGQDDDVDLRQRRLRLLELEHAAC